METVKPLHPVADPIFFFLGIAGKALYIGTDENNAAVLI